MHSLRHFSCRSLLIDFLLLFIGSESDAVSSELQNRKEAPSQKSDSNSVETISESMETSTTVSDNANANDDKESEPSETVKTHIDKKNQ